MPRNDPLAVTLYVIRAEPASHGDEPVAMAPADLGVAAASIRSGGAVEAAVLSTPGRTECYVVAHGADAALDAVRAGLRAMTPDGWLEATPPRVIAGVAAARHLLRVACGLESRVPGGAPALAQVQEAYDAALRRRAAGPLVRAVFECALRAGARVRAASEGEAAAERIVADELDRFEEWRARREAFAAVLA